VKNKARIEFSKQLPRSYQNKFFDHTLKSDGLYQPKHMNLVRPKLQNMLQFG
jgi:hypothetical protein